MDGDRKRKVGIAGKLFGLICMLALSVFLILNAVLPHFFILALREEAMGNDMTRNYQVMAQLDAMLGIMDSTGRSIRLDRSLENLIRRSDIEEDNAARFDLRQVLNQYVVNSSGRLVSAILDLDNRTVYSNAELLTAEKELLDQQWYVDFKESGQKRGYSKVFQVNYQDTSGRGAGKATAIAIALPYLGPQGTKGTLVLVCSLASLIQNCTYSLEISQVDFVLLDSENHPFYPYLQEEKTLVDLNEVTSILKTQTVGRNFAWEDKDAYTLIATSRYGDLKLVTKTTWEQMLYPYRNIIRFISISVFTAIMLILCFIFPVVFRMLRPLRQLSVSMKEVADGNFMREIQSSTHDEVHDLTVSFNEMSRRLQGYFERLKEEEKEKERLRLNLIVAQISPHFIYNTMNTITYLARKNKTEDVIRVNSILIGLLRDRLRISDINVMCPISEEINVIDQYAVLQTYRYGEVFHIAWDIDSEMSQEKIPKYIIQPLVENALFHGLLPNKEANGDVMGGKIHVRILREGTQTIIAVSDNGRGIDKIKLEELNRLITGKIEGGNCIGLKNVAMRLRILYGNATQMSITSQQGMTTVELRFEAQQEETP